MTMKRLLLLVGLGGIALYLAGPRTFADAGPYQGGKFKGRIGYSADGNHNDPDDWAASPVALAIFAESGLKSHVVHFDYNCILPQTDREWAEIHAESVLGAAERYSYDKAIFHDCRRDLDAAVASIARAIDASSADDPFYFIVAGPMEAPYLGIQKSNPAKRRHVYCISHSRWNDGFAAKYTFTHTKRSVIPSGVNWVQIQDQNPLLSKSRYGQPARPEEFQSYFWMRDSADSKVRFLWERMKASTRPDPSDAGMAYFLATGDEQCDPEKLKRLLEDHAAPTPISARDRIRLEAENFQSLEGWEVEDRNDRTASHRLQVRLTSTPGRIRTRFDEPFAPTQARYDVEVRYFDSKDQECRFSLLINSAAQSAAWQSSGQGSGWATHTIPDVQVSAGDEIAIEAQGAGGKLDYVQFNFKPSAKSAHD
jgi:hypothetical protein